MTRSHIILLAVLELVAFAVIAHLWVKRRRKGIVARLLWTLVLLVPFVGILIYGLTRADPSAHSDDLPEAYDGDIWH